MIADIFLIPFAAVKPRDKLSNCPMGFAGTVMLQKLINLLLTLRFLMLSWNPLAEEM